jgi:stearoyl-CoA desaturase (delta-9 desaturase)
MADATVQLVRVENNEVSNRDIFSPSRVAFFIAIHLGVFAVFWQTTWSAIAVAAILHMICGGFGICVGYHRLLTHRSFKCPKFVEYAMALAGTLSMQGGPIEWVALHRKHHQHSDHDGDPHNANDGFWWSHMLWVLHIPTRKMWKSIREKYTPDLQRQPFYRALEKINLLGSVILAVVLYLIGGWPWVVWGVCVRLVSTYHITWFVNSASHTWGYKTFKSNDLSTNCWWVALLSYGEGWHNNHHAFPTSARHGMKPWEIDFSYYFIKLLKWVGLAWEVHVPSADAMKKKVFDAASDFKQKADELAESVSQKADALAESMTPPQPFPATGK